jgi:hypothetical protein
MQHQSTAKKKRTSSSGRTAARVICVGIFFTMVTALFIFYHFSKYDTDPLSSFNVGSGYATALRRRVVEKSLENIQTSQTFARGYIHQHLRGLRQGRNQIDAIVNQTAQDVLYFKDYLVDYKQWYRSNTDLKVEATAARTAIDYFTCADGSSATALLNDDYCECRFVLLKYFHNAF